MSAPAMMVPPGVGLAALEMRGRIFKADEGSRVGFATVAADEGDFPGKRLRIALKDGEGGQTVAQSFLVDKGRVPFIEAHQFDQAATDQLINRLEADAVRKGDGAESVVSGSNK